jgi:hypothetical protein
MSKAKPTEISASIGLDMGASIDAEFMAVVGIG